MAKGKRINKSLESYDPDKFYQPSEAFQILSKFDKAKFDESVDVGLQLGVDPTKADQIVRGTVSLPAGTGKKVRIAVFAEGDAAAEAKEAGADFVGGSDLVSEVEGGMMDFDLAISTPEMMPQVGKLGKALGPRGLMPNPKTGTVTKNVGQAVKEFQGGMVEYRTDKNANVHVSIGKASFSEDDLKKNFSALIKELLRAKPAASKGKYFKKVTVSLTMSPSVKVDVSRLDD